MCLLLWFSCCVVILLFASKQLFVSLFFFFFGWGLSVAVFLPYQYSDVKSYTSIFSFHLCIITALTHTLFSVQADFYVSAPTDGGSGNSPACDRMLPYFHGLASRRKADNLPSLTCINSL